MGNKDSMSSSDETVAQTGMRLSVNLSAEVAGIFKSLISRKGLSMTEGVRRAIIIWQFIEDERDQGNQIAVIEKDGTTRTIVFL